MEKKDIVVVIPIYKVVLSHYEKASLRQCVDILYDYSLVIIKPESLDVGILLQDYPTLKIESFSDSCFCSLRAYNKLVLEENFYKRFLAYKYMLIYQLDAYVFRDELLDWANRGYDYIGAPWLPERLEGKIGNCRIILLKHFFYRLINSPKLRRWKYFVYGVGNGGFSLRNIAKMIKVTHVYRSKIMLLLDDEKEFYPEDILLFVEIRKISCRLKTPRYNEALKFSMEVGAEWAFAYNKQQLPFGCHAWYHKDSCSFWSKYIKKCQ